MENKINIAQLLENCLKGMELNCTTWENVTFEKVRDDNIFIRRNNKQPLHDSIVVLNEYGCVTNHEDEKCRIFPKGKTTWEGFQRPFMDGDIVATNSELQVFILQRAKSNTKGYCYIGYDFEYNELFDAGVWEFDRLATEEEKAKLFQAIKDNGYKWNAETKTLEKLPKFKVGNIIKSKEPKPTINIITKVYENYYELDDGGVLPLNYQDNWELVPNKFDITTLKSFESRVLVRDDSCYEWEADIFGRYSDGYITLGGGKWKQCIPYEGNEHLLGTTNDCDDFYKTWK